MTAVGVQPNEVTFTVLLSCAANMKSLSATQRIHQHLMNHPTAKQHAHTRTRDTHTHTLVFIELSCIARAYHVHVTCVCVSPLRVRACVRVCVSSCMVSSSNTSRCGVLLTGAWSPSHKPPSHPQCVCVYRTHTHTNTRTLTHTTLTAALSWANNQPRSLSHTHERVYTRTALVVKV